MKKRVLSLVLTLTILASMCAFAPLGASADNETIQYNRESGTIYQVRPYFYTADAFKIVGSKSYSDSLVIENKPLYVENACTLEAIGYIEIRITKVATGTTLMEYCDAIWDEINLKYVPFPGTIESYYIDTYSGEQTTTYKKLDEGTYIVDVTKGGDGTSILVIVGNGNSEKEISVYLNDKKIEFDVPPVVEEGRTLVPLRAIFEAMGMTVGWDGATSTITATGNGNSISMKANETTAMVNGKMLTMDVPSKVVDGRTLVPVRFIAESLGAEVNWDGENRIVNIHTKVLSDDKTRLFPVTYTSALPNLGDITIDFYYSDSYFVNGDGYSYNHDLARASLAYEISSWDANELETMYNDKLKVENYQLYNYDKSLDDGSDKAAYSIAHKKLYDSTTLISVAVRGANYGAEWKSDFHVGTTCYHKGFYDPAYEIYENLKTYAKVHNIDLNSTRMWITGYSRGAAIGNLVSGFIDRDILNNGKKYFDNGNRLYSYLFAVPNGVDAQYIDTSNRIFDNIYNIILPYDAIPKVVMEEWGWGRFGQTLMVKSRNSNPQNANEKYFKKLTNNMYDYNVGKQQVIAGNKAATILAVLAESPKEYSRTYEKTIMDFAEWAFWVSEKNNDKSPKNLANYIYENYKKGCYPDSDFTKSGWYAGEQIEKNDIVALVADAVDVKEYLYLILQMFYLNGYRGDAVDLISNVTDTYSFKQLLLLAFDKNVLSIADAHNSEYYISWMFGYDNPQDIFQDFN